MISNDIKDISAELFAEQFSINFKQNVKDKKVIFPNLKISDEIPDRKHAQILFFKSDSTYDYVVNGFLENMKEMNVVYTNPSVEWSGHKKFTMNKNNLDDTVETVRLDHFDNGVFFVFRFKYTFSGLTSVQIVFWGK